MWQSVYQSFGVHSFGGGLLLALLVIWSIIWKGLALWKAAKTDRKVWFVVFLFVNTLGILEIIYLYVFSERNFKKAVGVSGEEKTEEKKIEDKKEEVK